MSEPQVPETTETAPSEDAKRRIGVYICHCGGNISDYVDVAKVREAVAQDPDVVVAETTLFACSDGQQHDMVDDITGQKLDGLVVASCSPKLHTTTFRGVARRADLNPYAYTQVNIREQDSWAHTDDYDGATTRAIALVQAGIAKTRLSTPLEPLRIETVPATMVVGGGVAGLRAAIGLADIGIAVTIVEKAPEVGGWLGKLGPMFPHDRSGREQIAHLLAEIGQAADHHRADQRRAGRQDRLVRQLHGQGPAAHRDDRGAAPAPGRHVRDRHGRRRVRPGGRRVRLRHRRRRDAARVRRPGRRGEGWRAGLARPAGPLDRLRVLRGQPPGRRQRVLLEVLLRGDGARLDQGRQARPDDQAVPPAP